MGIVVTEQYVERHTVQQAQHLGRAGASDVPQQVEAGFQVGTAFVLVFHFRRHAERLAEIFLMQARRVAVRIGLAIIARYQQEATSATLMNSRFGNRQFDIPARTF